MDISSKPKFSFIVFVIFISILVLAGFFLKVDKDKIDKLLSGMPVWLAVILFLSLYIGGTFFIWGLKDPLKIVGAFLFGPGLSAFLIYISEVTNACIFFNLARKFGKDFVEEKLGDKFQGFYKKLGNTNFWFAVFLRANPFIPFRFLDLSFGLSRFSFKRYMAIVLAASWPRIFWVQFPLSAMRQFSAYAMLEYYKSHPLIMMGELFYAVFIVIAAFLIKNKFSDK